MCVNENTEYLTRIELQIICDVTNHDFTLKSNFFLVRENIVSNSALLS